MPPNGAQSVSGKRHKVFRRGGVQTDSGSKGKKRQWVNARYEEPEGDNKLGNSYPGLRTLS